MLFNSYLVFLRVLCSPVNPSVFLEAGENSLRSKLTSTHISTAYFYWKRVRPLPRDWRDRCVRSLNAGGLGLLWSLAFCFTVYESPEEHPRITREEVQYINDALGGPTPKSVSVLLTSSRVKSDRNALNWQIDRSVQRNWAGILVQCISVALHTVIKVIFEK